MTGQKKILITTSSYDLGDNSVIADLERSGFQIQTNPFGRKLTEAEISDMMGPDVVGIIAGVEPLTGAVMDLGPNLRVISRCGTGMDTVDLEAASERGIVVRNTPDALTSAVAELAIGLMLAVLRKIPLSDRAMRNGEWRPLVGNLLGGKTVGILGFGRIGQCVAKYVAAFGADVMFHDPQLAADATAIRSVGFDELLESSEILTLHLPYSEATHHVIDALAISKMKRDAFLINASRGGLVDEGALAAALGDGKLGGCGLDTFEEEPYTGELLGFDNVVLTAHMGSRAVEARHPMEEEAARNLVEGLGSGGIRQ